MSIRLLVFRATVAFTGILPLSASGQTLIDPARAAAATGGGLTRREAPLAPGTLEDDAMFVPSTPGDQDIGQQVLLQRDERSKAFSVWLDSSEFWTDNAANVSDGAQEDWFYTGGVTFAYQPRLTQRLYLDTYAGQHWYRYSDLDVLDYEVGEGGAGVIIPMPELWDSLWHVRYYYERITQDIGDSPIYQTHSLHFGGQKSIHFDRRNRLDLALLGSVAMDTEPDILSRHEYALATAWTYKVTQEIGFSLSYRLAYYDYFNLDSRHDWYHNFAVALTYRPTPWCELAASYNYTLNESNLDAFNYEAQLAGPSISVTVRF